MEYSIEELNKSFFNPLVMWIKRKRFGTKRQLAFLEDLYLLINDGIPANRAVEMMTQVTSGITREVAQTLTQKISEGQQLADGMREWFQPSVVEIIRVGEAGGALGQTMKSAINSLNARGAAVGGFVVAVAYPLLVIVMACVMVVYLDKAVFSQFALIKPMSQWPPSGQRLVALGHFIKYWWWISIVIVIVIGFIFSKLMTSYTGALRPTLDRFPPFTLYKQLVCAQFLETLGLLVGNGIVFKSALRVMQYSSSPYLTMHLIEMEHLLSAGKSNIADVLATGLIPPNDLMRLRIMAEVKGFEHGLTRMGIKGAEQAARTMSVIAKLLGGILLCIGAYLIITIMLGISQTGMSMGSM